MYKVEQVSYGGHPMSIVLNGSSVCGIVLPGPRAEVRRPIVVSGVRNKTITDTFGGESMKTGTISGRDLVAWLDECPQAVSVHGVSFAREAVLELVMLLGVSVADLLLVEVLQEHHDPKADRDGCPVRIRRSNDVGVLMPVEPVRTSAWMPLLAVPNVPPDASWLRVLEASQ